LVCLTATGGKGGAIVFGSAIFMVCSTILFAMSAIYNLFNWRDSVKQVLRRIDHANIFLLISGTYTPIALVALPWEMSEDVAFNQSGMMLLISIWLLTVVGLALHVIWINAPRPLYVIIYILLGLFAVVFLPAMVQFGNSCAVGAVALIGSGGLCYIIGAIFYACKWPGRNARIFGFHELFHIFTIFAFACHTVAIYLLVLAN
jgi:hemolysin III